MHRFFIPPTWISEDVVIFTDPVAHQINRVLRLRPGQHVIVLNNTGSEFEVELIEVGANAMGKIIDRRTVLTEPACQISLYLGLTQREKFEWMLQKCTEVGASIFIPIITSRTLINSGPKDGNKNQGQKQERWERIIQEAAEQSGRGVIPRLKAATAFREALQQACSENEMVLIPYEDEMHLRMVDAIQEKNSKRKLTSLALFIGPEGGFADEEIREGRETGAVTVTLGRRILRMETAAVVAAALALGQLGE